MYIIYNLLSNFLSKKFYYEISIFGSSEHGALEHVDENFRPLIHVPGENQVYFGHEAWKRRKKRRARPYRAGNQPTYSELLPAEAGAEADKWPTHSWRPTRRQAA